MKELLGNLEGDITDLANFSAAFALVLSYQMECDNTPPSFLNAMHHFQVTLDDAIGRLGDDAIALLAASREGKPAISETSFH